MSQSRRGTPQPAGRARRPKVAGRMGVGAAGADEVAPSQGSGDPAGAGPSVLVLDKEQPQPAAAPATPEQRRRRWVLIGAALTVVLAVVALLAALTKPQEAQIPKSSPDAAFVDTGVTEEVVNRSKEAIEGISSYGFQTLDADFDRARTYLSAEMAAEFDLGVDVIRTAAEQRRLVVTAVVDHVGVQRIEGDRAEVLALTTVTQTFEDGNEEVYRGPVKAVLERRDGQWIVTEIA